MGFNFAECKKFTKSVEIFPTAARLVSGQGHDAQLQRKTELR